MRPAFSIGPLDASRNIGIGLLSPFRCPLLLRLAIQLSPPGKHSSLNRQRAPRRNHRRITNGWIRGPRRNARSSCPRKEESLSPRKICRAGVVFRNASRRALRLWVPPLRSAFNIKVPHLRARKILQSNTRETDPTHVEDTAHHPRRTLATLEASTLHHPHSRNLGRAAGENGQRGNNAQWA